ncbi:hypothetical protein BU25DRAFT_8200 [Macroventuria anomochaeta]|uniref:Uncharacterized protein n=1 Tax=Macroventuria anomochaeta TaxID=301207 RepID=A0ACB6SIT1_9PLEO|nr:uncharacterized protein BU25DRAFT_8200 [Macroventuria anomochaeta]KAF2633535.1 hypothetical protein BU25DRAFT_8200 [Macroventuria anomochaeta]
MVTRPCCLGPNRSPRFDHPPGLHPMFQYPPSRRAASSRHQPSLEPSILSNPSDEYRSLKKSALSSIKPCTMSCIRFHCSSL